MNKQLISALLLMVACQKMNPEKNMKESLKIDFQEGDLTSLHPHDLIIQLRGISIGKTLFEGLTRIGADGKAVMAGAKSVSISPDGLTLTFQLRDNHWSDGTKVVASQYESAWKEALSPTSSCKRSDLLYMINNALQVKKGELPLSSLGVKAVDDQTLIVELSRPSPHFLELLAQPICAPLKDIHDKTIANFNGPFMLDKWKKNANLRLKPNPYFWNREKVSLPQIDVFMVQDPETTYALYEQKELDWIGVPLCPLSIEQIGRLQEKKDLRSELIERAFWIYLNTKHPSLSSPSIRKALSLAISRETITGSFLIGGCPLEKALPHSLLPLSPESSLKEDPETARAFFEKGLKELGLTKETFPPITITYAQQANRKQLAEYLQKTWGQVLGISVNIESQEWNTLRSNLAAGQFDVVGTFEASYCADPLELMERMMNASSANFPQWVFTTYQEKIAAATQEVSPKKRMALLSEAEEILMDQMPFIPVSSDRFLFAHHSNLKDYTFDSLGAVDFSYAQLY